jgi:hypothetical protein
MSVDTITHFDWQTALQAWAQDTPRLAVASLTQGGWERWAQVDFYSYLCLCQVKCLCEAGVYDRNKSLDLLIYPQNNQQGVMLEFKCMSFADQPEEYLGKIGQDIWKLLSTELRKTFQPPEAEYKSWAVGLARLDVLLKDCGVTSWDKLQEELSKRMPKVQMPTNPLVTYRLEHKLLQLDNMGVTLVVTKAEIIRSVIKK